eukprot:TRINITY_DN646_c0_g1_i1.p1 TRINITY_DN646_c0_g1~~TRINITY_DN646_c0_g1_i1.p1  ORF type:complete len:506 (+),score=140.78 TRINITY_DN646_c0_g1_i1:565-2082(+)
MATPFETAERLCKECTPPRPEPLPRSEMFKNGKPDPEVLKAHFLNEGKLANEDAIELIEQATAIFKSESTLLTLDTPMTVCGDIHGQFYDLVRLFEIGGPPSNTRYLFLGDYVDRGCFSCEVCFYLFALKINYPKNIYMLRGNHECRHLTNYFNFKIECRKKYDLPLYKKLMEAFDCLPLAALLNKKFLCVHGGISPDIKKVSDINNINRFREPPTSGPMCDLLWADPMEESPDNTDVGFVPNNTRGCSYFYGYAAACKFLEDNDILSIIRAHEAEDEGYRMYRKRDSTEFPTVITLFSAPNYLDVYNNKGAILKFDENVLNIQQFSSSPHPYWLPNFMDVFTWSLPFVAEKVTEMLLAILNVVEDDDVSDDEEGDDDYLSAVQEAARTGGKPAAAQPALPITSEERKSRIRKKIISVSKMSRMFGTLRQERETILQLKGLAPGNKIPRGLLQAGAAAIRQALSTFEEARKADRVNEHIPPPSDDGDDTGPGHGANVGLGGLSVS